MTRVEERETKIRVSAARAREKLENIGARLTSERSFEENWVLDTPDQDLRQAGCLLRLRHRDHRWLLTLKEPGHEEGGHKVRHETETEVEAGPALLHVFDVLGYSLSWRYQKWRTTYRLEGVVVCLDETPLGDFLELEGPPGATEKVAERLGHGPEEFLDTSYGHLWFEGGNTGEMVFEDTEGEAPEPPWSSEDREPEVP